MQLSDRDKVKVVMHDLLFNDSAEIFVRFEDDAEAILVMDRVLDGLNRLWMQLDKEVNAIRKRRAK